MRLPPLKNRYLTALASLKTGIVLMVALALVSIFGTLLKYEDALKVVFYSWWFRALLLALATNLVFCTYQTLAQRVLPSFHPPFPKSQDFYENGSMRYSVETSRSPDDIEAALRRRGYRTARKGVYIRARKGQFRSLAAPLAHTGIVVMLTGGFAAGLLAYNGSVTLVEGESTTTMQVRGKKPARRPLGFRLSCLDFDTGVFPQTQIPSRFVSTLEVQDGDTRFVETVEVNKSLKWRGLKFHQSGFDKITRGSRYGVSVVDTAASRSVETAATVGYRTPVADWGLDLLLEQSIAGMRYTVFDGDEVVTTRFIASDASSLELQAVEFLPDFVIGPDNVAVSRSQKMNNPALQVAWIRDGRVLSKQWLFLRADFRRFTHGQATATRLELTDATAGSDGVLEFHLDAFDATSNAHLGHFTMRLDDTVRIADLGILEEPAESEPTTDTVAGAGVPGRCEVEILEPQTLYYTALSVSSNPMIPAIYFGSILACLGVCLALYLRRTTLWVLCRSEEGRALVAVQYVPERTALTAGVEKTLEALR